MKVLHPNIHEATNLYHAGRPSLAPSNLSVARVKYGIVNTTSAKQTISTFLPDRIDFIVKDSMGATL